MRPRVFPAEDAVREIRPFGAGSASMRPRVFPAEDALSNSDWLICSCASMRPRVFPAEDVPRPVTSSSKLSLQ